MLIIVDDTFSKILISSVIQIWTKLVQRRIFHLWTSAWLFFFFPFFFFEEAQLDLTQVVERGCRDRGVKCHTDRRSERLL